MSMRMIVPLAGLLATLAAPRKLRRRRPSASPQSAQREAVMAATAVVESVDPTSRVVRVRTNDGREITVIAGPEVRNLAQVSAGDTVRLNYYESVAVRMAEPGAGGPTSASVVSSRAPVGATPAGVVGNMVDMVVEFIAYDPATAIATFKTPEGVTQSILVNPAMRAFAAARRPGERVAIQVRTAVAAAIVETAP